MLDVAATGLSGCSPEDSTRLAARQDVGLQISCNCDNCDNLANILPSLENIDSQIGYS